MFVLGVFTLLAPLGNAQALSSEVSITKDGVASVSNAKVMQIAGNTFFSRLYWGDSYIRMTIKTNAKTKFFRATGEATTLAEVAVGDLLDISGELQTGVDTLTLIAHTIKNSSVQKEQAVLSGKITAIDLSLRQFTIESKKAGTVTIKVAATTPFTKGSRTIDIGHLRVGDTISKAAGDHDLATKTLSVTTAPIVVHVDMTLFKPRNFVGTLTEAPNTGATTLKVTIGGTLHIITLNDKTAIMKKDKSSIGLNRFVAGDIIRLYGTLRESDDPAIDNVEVVRNMSL